MLSRDFQKTDVQIFVTYRFRDSNEFYKAKKYRKKKQTRKYIYYWSNSTGGASFVPARILKTGNQEPSGSRSTKLNRKKILLFISFMSLCFLFKSKFRQWPSSVYFWRSWKRQDKENNNKKLLDRFTNITLLNCKMLEQAIQHHHCAFQRDCIIIWPYCVIAVV